MRIQADIDVKVSVYYLDIEGLRFPPYRSSDRMAEWGRIRAAAGVHPDGSLAAIYITGSGNFIKKDGTPGQQTSRLSFGSIGSLPEEWQTRITKDLETLAARVTVEQVDGVVVGE